MSTSFCSETVAGRLPEVVALHGVGDVAPSGKNETLSKSVAASAANATRPAVNEPVRVLLIEDNPDDAKLLTHALQQTRTRFEVCCVDNLAAAREQLQNDAFDVILTDLSLPDSDGVDSVIAIRQCAASTPLVVMTGLNSDSMALEALKRGAQDYLVKDTVTSEMLERAIRYAIQRQKNTELEQCLATLHASERLLARKNKKLTRLNRMAHRFVDNVSHEFRTPLTVISEYVSIVRDGLAGELNKKQHRLLDISVDRTGDLNNMVNDMLDISRLSVGILGLYRKSCSLEDIITRVRSNLARKARIKGVILAIEVPANLPPVYCDAEKIGRVLTNLAINAIKFSGESGYVRIRVVADLPAQQAGISVTDTGPGVDPKRLGQLFKRFKQLGTASSESTKGFGLGLNIAKELVDLNFGEIRVESGVGVGSTFSFTVPFDHPIELTRRYLRQVQKKGLSELSLLHIEVDSQIEDVLADDVDVFLNHLLRRHDMIYRTTPRRWVLLLAASASDVKLFLSRGRRSLGDTNRNRPCGPLPKLTPNLIGTYPIDESQILSVVRDFLEPQQDTLPVASNNSAENSPQLVATCCVNHDVVDGRSK